MNVKLISLSKSYIHGISSAEELIVYCARVSNPQNQLNTDTTGKLISYCIKNHHWSIFEQATMTVEIVTSRAIAQQILRHRSFSFQEFSQRYTNVTNFEDIEWRKQGKTNRQVGDEPVILPKEINDVTQSILAASKSAYDLLIQSGVAKESARFILPLCTQTTLYMTGNIRSWIHYLQIRCSEHTQKEHRDIANEIKNNVFKVNFPLIAKELGF